VRPAATPRPNALLLVAILLVGINLRGAIAAVSPVLQEIRADLDMSGTVAGLLTALPVVCFGLVAPAAAWLGGRLGIDRAILLACVVIAAGTVGRVLGGSVLLLVGTLVVGAAITVGNVLVPVVAKRDFPDRANNVTGLLTAALCTGAAVTTALTAPLSAAASSWRIGLASWAVLAVAAAVVWQLATARQTVVTVSPGEAPAALDRASDNRRAGAGLWGSWLAWAVALFLGAQAAAYYAVTAWLPTLLTQHAEIRVETASTAAAVFQILGIAGTLLVAALATVARLRWTAGLVAASWAVLFAGLLWAPAAWPAWILIGGTGQGGGIALAMTLVVVRAYDDVVARGLSAMAQLVGYTVGAAGPLVVGALYEQTGAWPVPLLVMLGLAGCIAATGIAAGRQATVGDPAVRQN
jgi:MFS transporter, CP family, cyanate transporter